MTATTSPTRSPNTGYAIALTGVLFWSSTAIFISYLLNHYMLAPLTLAFWRDLFVSVALGLSLFLFRRDLLKIERRHRLFLTGYGVTLAVFNMLWTYSVALNGAAAATVLAYSSPALTALIARKALNEPLTRRRAVAIVVSITGCVLVSGAYEAKAWAVNPVGIVVGLGSGLGFACYSILGKFSSRRLLNPWTATWASFGIAAVVLLFTQTGATLFTLGNAIDGWLILIVLAIVPSLGGYGLYTVSLGYLPAGTANLIATLEPALTAILAFIVLHGTLTPVQLVGSALIVGSVVSLTKT
jgi:drug/metabolite transporter (DMT)-like permease